MTRATILAAGTVPWRRTRSGNIKVLVIRRRKLRDWSFPKGKVDKGESLAAAAVRETREETGLQLNLGVNLGMINYIVGEDIKKTVQYWAAEVDAKTAAAYTFEPNDEVVRVKWVHVSEAPSLLTYPADRELFDVFERLVREGLHETFQLILLRHAKAEPRSAEYPMDHERPLSAAGIEQARAIVPVLAAFGPERIVSSPAVRCADTVAPLAVHLGIDEEFESGISQDTWDSGETRDLRECVSRAVQHGRSAVLCSHRPVLPDLTREIAAAVRERPGRYLREASELPPGAFSVFHIARVTDSPDERRIVSVEVYPIKP